VIRLTVKFIVLASIIILIDHVAASFLKNGLDKVFKLDRAASVLCIGNSHTKDAIDDELLEKGLGVNVAKYAFRGSNTFDRLAMIRQFVSEYPGALRLVVYDVDDHTFTSERHHSKTYTTLYPYIGNPEIGRYVKESAGSWEEYISRKYIWMLRYTPELRNSALSPSFTKQHGTNSTKTVSNEEIVRDIASFGKEYGAIKIDPDNTRCFEDTIRFVRSQGAVLVLLYLPVTDLWNSVVDRDKHQHAVSTLKQYASGDRGVIFLNYKDTFGHRLELYYDRAHMNITGKKLLTSTLYNDIKSFVN
jgi:hypothetical protein